MAVIEPVIRPPAEAGSFLLQVTTGCSANHCSFCGAYMNKSFSIKSYEEIISDIKYESDTNTTVFSLQSTSKNISNILRVYNLTIKTLLSTSTFKYLASRNIF